MLSHLEAVQGCSAEEEAEAWDAFLEQQGPQKKGRGALTKHTMSGAKGVHHVLRFFSFGESPEDAYRLCVALGLFSAVDVSPCLSLTHSLTHSHTLSSP